MAETHIEYTVAAEAAELAFCFPLASTSFIIIKDRPIDSLSVFLWGSRDRCIDHGSRDGNPVRTVSFVPWTALVSPGNADQDLIDLHVFEV